MKRGFVGTHLSEVPELLPGSHIVLIGDDPLTSMRGRYQSLEVRDTLLVLEQNRTRFAVLLRVPFQGTVAENVLRHGQGGLWIDGCRISTTDVFGGGATMSSSGHTLGKFNRTHTRGDLKPGSTLGRWPTNLVLIHGEGCRLVGTKRVQSQNPTVRKPSPSKMFTDYGWREVGQKIGYGDEDGTETVAAWECREDCVVKALDQQSGTLHSHGGGQSHTLGFGDMRKENGWAIPKGDSGGASRFYPQFAGESELLEWLGRLIGL